MDQLQTGVEFALGVLPKTPVLFQPCEAALDHPALGYDLEGMQLAALGDLHGHVFAQDLLHALCEGLAHIAAVGQDALHVDQVGLAAPKRLQRAFSISDLGRGHRDRMRQSLGVDRDMSLDPRHLLARVIPLCPGRVRVLHALRVHDQERAGGVAPLSLAGRANLIF